MKKRGSSGAFNIDGGAAGGEEDQYSDNEKHLIETLGVNKWHMK